MISTPSYGLFVQKEVYKKETLSLPQQGSELCNRAKNNTSHQTHLNGTDRNGYSNIRGPGGKTRPVWSNFWVKFQLFIGIYKENNFLPPDIDI